MGRKKRGNGWDEIDGGAAFIIPYTTLRHPNFTRLSAFGVKLLLDLGRQYTGFNNGYLCASWALMKDAGWNSSHTVQKATLECEHYRLIKRTQQGGLNKPNLHGFTWRVINEKAGQRIDSLPEIAPSNAWKLEQPDFVLPSPKRRKSWRKSSLRAA